jgi:hypothetical protein
VADKLELIASDPKNQILITDSLDDICKAGCPYRKQDLCERNDGIIVNDEEAAKIDRKFIEAFDLENGKMYSLKGLIKKIHQSAI